MKKQVSFFGKYLDTPFDFVIDLSKSLGKIYFLLHAINKPQT